MRHAVAIAGREFKSLFSTPVGYVLMAGYLVLAAYFFFIGLAVFLQNLQVVQTIQRFELLEQLNLGDQVITPAFGTFSFFFILLVPLITMRAFSEERANGTLELLLTSPLTVWEIVIGKYLSVLVMIAILVGLTASYPALLFYYGDPELWQTLAGLLTLFLYGAALAAIGCFVSALTRNQIIAGMVGIVTGLFLLVLPLVASSTS